MWVYGVGEGMVWGYGATLDSRSCRVMRYCHRHILRPANRQRKAYAVWAEFGVGHMVGYSLDVVGVIGYDK